MTQLKKVYSVLSNTTNLAIADEGPVSGWNIVAHMTGQSAIDFANKYLIPYLKVSKNCGTQTTGDCAFKWTTLNRGSSGSHGAEFARFYLTDGTLIAVRTQKGATDQRVNVFIDLNGQKSPNMHGKDIFYYNYFIVHETPSVIGKFMPEWYTADRNYLKSKCTKDGTDAGTSFGCTMLIMKDGWQISDDYPW